MTITNLIALVFIFLFFVLMIFFVFVRGKQRDRGLRDIPAFTRIRRAIGLAVESGSRIHISLGSSSITRNQSASALIGLTLLEQMARTASISDLPPLATSGDATLAILAQDTLRASYIDSGAKDQYDPVLGQITGLTPFSYAAGTLPIIRDGKVSANLVMGNFGSELALITDACERSGTATLVGSDNISTQSILYATAQEPLIGEELFASGAYMHAGAMHDASLHVQDIFRWVLVAVIIFGIILKLLGIDQFLADVLPGIF